MRTVTVVSVVGVCLLSLLSQLLVFVYCHCCCLHATLQYTWNSHLYKQNVLIVQTLYFADDALRLCLRGNKNKSPHITTASYNFSFSESDSDSEADWNKARGALEAVGSNVAALCLRRSHTAMDEE